MENNKYHILIVDDDDRIRNLLKDYLSENNYIISTSENANQAKEKLNWSPKIPFKNLVKEKQLI